MVRDLSTTRARLILGVGWGVGGGFAWRRLHGEPGHAGQAAVVTSGQGPTSHSAFVLGFARRMTG